MRKLFLSLAAAAMTMAAAMLMPSDANAAVTTPSAVRPAIAGTNVVDNVRWFRVCHHHWRNSYSHCRPVWRPGHHHHHHRHHHHRHHHHRHHHHRHHHRHRR